MFSIKVDPSRKLVNVRMSGFMTPAEVAEFSRLEQQMIASLGYRSGGYYLLINTEDAVIQSQEVVARFTEIVANSPYKARRIAVVRGSSLTRMQTQRILMIREGTAIFATLPEAEAWLFGPETPGDGQALR